MATSTATVATAGILSSAAPSLNSLSVSSSRVVATRPAFLCVRAATKDEAHNPSTTSRRALISVLVGSAPAFLLAKEALADAAAIKVEGPPPPSGGLPGTENADEARDVDLPLKERFYLQPLSPPEAAARAKDSAKDIVAVKALIDKKAWPYVQNELRLKASYLRFDLRTIVASKSKNEKKALQLLISKLNDTINNLDYAARSKSVPSAEKYYAETVSTLNDVLAKIG